MGISTDSASHSSLERRCSVKSISAWYLQTRKMLSGSYAKPGFSSLPQLQASCGKYWINLKSGQAQWGNIGNRQDFPVRLVPAYIATATCTHKPRGCTGQVEKDSKVQQRHLWRLASDIGVWEYRKTCRSARLTSAVRSGDWCISFILHDLASPTRHLVSGV